MVFREFSFLDGWMDWRGLDLQDRNYWIRDLVFLDVWSWDDLNLLDGVFRLSLNWLLHLKFQRVHYQLNSFTKTQVLTASFFLTHLGFSPTGGDNTAHAFMIRIVVGGSGYSHPRRRSTMVSMVQNTLKEMIVANTALKLLSY